MDNGGGYVKVFRSVFDGFLWKEKREFSKAESFLDLLQSAHWDPERPGKFLHQGRVVAYSRGQLVASVRHLKERWGWKSNEKVTKFLDLLREDGLVTTRNEEGITVITLVNYGLNDVNPIHALGTLPNFGHQSDDEKNKIEHRTDTDNPILTVGSFELSETKSNTERTPNRIQNERGPNNIKENKELINNNRDNAPADALPGDAGSEEKNYLLPEILKKDYIAAQKFIISAGQLPKLKNLSPEEYEKLREHYTHGQLMEQLAEMEDYPKLQQKHKSIYLTLLNWCKSQYGKPEMLDLYDRMEKRYRDFVYSITETSAIIDRHQREALHNLGEYLLKNSKDKTPEAAFKNWCHILHDENWKKMDNFQQRRIKLSEIYGDILKIIKAQKDDPNNRRNAEKGREDSGKAKTFSTEL